jgi:radical SAM superfamily enzyme with C-terminal helix-hairpin-helix motif
MAWLVVDGYEDEPAAFGVPPYIGFHIRYICGVLEAAGLEYHFVTIDSWRRGHRPPLSDLEGIVLFAGAIVPGKYLRGTPVSQREVDRLMAILPHNIPFFAGGWAIRGWRQAGWMPLRSNLFLCLQDTDATLSHYLKSGEFAHRRRTAEQWTKWAHAGAGSKAVTDHPDLFTHPGGGPDVLASADSLGSLGTAVNSGVGGPSGDSIEFEQQRWTEHSRPGPLTYEVEVYQGCVRYKRGCKFCIEPKKGVPLWREPEDIIREVETALDAGVRNVRLGGMTDVYSYMAEGVVELEYPIPDPEPITKLLHGLREDERLDILHVDNGNPSIIAENLEPAEEITRSLVKYTSDGNILSFGLESADPEVHTANWLNCNAEQLKVAIRHINEHGRGRGERGLPNLLPGLNFIAGLHAEQADRTYRLNRELLRSLRAEGLWLRRINIRQVEGEGFQPIPKTEFAAFKEWVRDEIDAPLLQELFPLGQRLNAVRWESHDSRTRLPAHTEEAAHRDLACLGKPGVTFGRQIGAYPILVGVPYHLPLESSCDVLVTGHGKRSITAIEAAISLENATEKQLAAIPGISKKSAWTIITERAKRKHRDRDAPAFENLEQVFEHLQRPVPEMAQQVLRC